MTDVPNRWVDADIDALQSAMQAGELSSVELVDFYLARIAAYDQQGPAINAVQHLAAAARVNAEKMDAERSAGRVRSALHGIPVLVKDNYATTDAPTTAGSVLFNDFQTDFDATLVTRLRAAGAVILGKTTMHEFAYGITTVGSKFGATLNPYDLQRNPGGSSGGTGAAITANFAAVGMGSDTCGSIRIPAAQNNLVGLRATQGLFSRAGIVPLSSTQDIGGPIARSVADLSIVLDATFGYDAADAQTRLAQNMAPPEYRAQLTLVRGARVGVLDDWMRQQMQDNPVAEVVDTALAQMQADAGWTLQRLTSPAVNESVDRAWNGHLVLIYDFKQDMNAWLAQHPELGLRDLQDLLSRGLHHPDVEPSLIASERMGEADREAYAREIEQRTVVRDALVALMDEHQLDALAYPTIREVATWLGREQMGTNCRLAANSGLPAMSVPAGFDAHGLPVGLELLGRPLSEQTLLNLAFTVEHALQQRRSPPHTP